MGNDKTEIMGSKPDPALEDAEQQCPHCSANMLAGDCLLYTSDAADE